MKTDKKLSDLRICALFFILVAISAQGVSSNVADNSIVSDSSVNSISGGMQNATSLNLSGLKCLSWSPCINGTQIRDCRLGVKDMSDRRQCNITQSVPQGSDYVNTPAGNNQENPESNNTVLTDDGSFWARLFSWMWRR